jgi:hypothetical protein
VAGGEQIGVSDESFDIPAHEGTFCGARLPRRHSWREQLSRLVRWTAAIVRAYYRKKQLSTVLGLQAAQAGPRNHLAKWIRLAMSSRPELSRKTGTSASLFSGDTGKEFAEKLYPNYPTGGNRAEIGGDFQNETQVAGRQEAMETRARQGRAE